MKGKTFLARGGNGQLTEPQKKLAAVLGWPMEYVIETAPVSGQFPSLPNCYKVDLAEPDLKIAVEVDGRSHDRPKWRFLDKRKTEILNALGWRVIRFRNELVTKELPAVVAELVAFAKAGAAVAS